MNSRRNKKAQEEVSYMDQVIKDGTIELYLSGKIHTYNVRMYAFTPTMEKNKLHILHRSLQSVSVASHVLRISHTYDVGMLSIS